MTPTRSRLRWRDGGLPWHLSNSSANILRLHNRDTIGRLDRQFDNFPTRRERRPCVPYRMAASISSAEYGTPGVRSSAPSFVIRYMSSRKNPCPSTEAIGSKLIVVPALNGPEG